MDIEGFKRLPDDEGWFDANGRVLDRVKLWETSVVVFPMNTLATVTRVKARGGGNLDLALAEAELALTCARLKALS